MKQQTVLITGASRGIGRHCADALHSVGYRVIGFSRTLPRAAKFEALKCDVSDWEQVSRCFKSFRREPGLYALINAAGTASMNLALTMPADSVRQIVATNLLGTIYCSQAAVPAMIRAKRGRIVNFSTIATALGLKGESVYVASKAGVEGFTRSFAREMADHNVTVNAIAPGPIATDLIQNVSSQQIEQIVARQIIPRMGTKDDVVKVISLLLSEEASMVTGEVIHLGGA
jgi:3-oxoacyl-[acyl-carrier protein] reductase